MERETTTKIILFSFTPRNKIIMKKKSTIEVSKLFLREENNRRDIDVEFAVTPSAFLLETLTWQRFCVP